MAVLTMAFIVGFFVVFVAFYLYRRFYAHAVFSKEGIPGPAPHWLAGNVLDLADDSTRHLVLPNWTKKYGKMFGYYEGPTPILVVSDVDMINQMFVKQANIFHGRKLMAMQGKPDDVEDMTSHMFQARGDRWKRLRQTVNPAFSTAKLRAMSLVMTKCQKDFMALIDERAASNKAFNIVDCFQELTLNTILETAFGVEFNALNPDDPAHPILATLREYWKNFISPPLVVKVALILPEIKPVLKGIDAFRHKVLDDGFLNVRQKVVEITKRIVEQRKAHPVLNRQDLLGSLLEVEGEVGRSVNKDQKVLAFAEIISQTLLFLIAGYETTSNALSFTAYNLAMHPEVQDKVIAEIDANFSRDLDKQVDYESVSEIKYLECVINESLRLFPVAAAAVTRMAMEDTTVNGIRIPKGMNIVPDSWSIHRDEEQWGPVDTEKFHPERFLDDYPTTSTRSAAAFIPFGFGPRFCIATKFAMLEMKMTFVNLLRKYRLVKGPETEENVEVVSFFALTPANGIWISLEKRK